MEITELRKLDISCYESVYFSSLLLKFQLKKLRMVDTCQIDGVKYTNMYHVIWPDNAAHMGFFLLSCDIDVIVFRVVWTQEYGFCPIRSGPLSDVVLSRIHIQSLAMWPLWQRYWNSCVWFIIQCLGDQLKLQKATRHFLTRTACLHAMTMLS